MLSIRGPSSSLNLIYRVGDCNNGSRKRIWHMQWITQPGFTISCTIQFKALFFLRFNVIVNCNSFFNIIRFPEISLHLMYFMVAHCVTLFRVQQLFRKEPRVITRIMLNLFYECPLRWQWCFKIWTLGMRRRGLICPNRPLWAPSGSLVDVRLKVWPSRLLLFCWDSFSCWCWTILPFELKAARQSCNEWAENAANFLHNFAE